MRMSKLNEAVLNKSFSSAEHFLVCSQVNDWFSSIGDVHLANKELGDSVAAAQNLQTQHMQFELLARVSVGACVPGRTS